MKTNQCKSLGRAGKLSIGAAAALLLAASAWASDPSETFRTLAYGLGVFQGTNLADKPVYAYQPIAGHDLVAAALGMPLGTVLSNQVLALKIDCASTTASLVVFDKPTTNIIASIASSTSMDVVQQQDRDLNRAPNRERFVAVFAISPTNDLVGGVLAMEGRLQLNPTNGCPRAIRIESDPKDSALADSPGNGSKDDSKDHDILRAGLGHAIGVVDLKSSSGTTNTVLLPNFGFSMRRQLD